MRAASNWVKELIAESTGKTFNVRPVILFPGWYVKRQKIPTDIWVLNPKAFPKFLGNEREQVAEEDVYLVSYHLKRYVRGASAKKLNR